VSLFGKNKNNARVKNVEALAKVCSGKSFQDLCSSYQEHLVTDFWDKNEQGPWGERFLQTNLTTLAQLTHKKKLKLRGWGALFEVGSSNGLWRTEDDSFEVLAGDVLAVLYRASLQIFCPTDQMLLEEMYRKAAEVRYGDASASVFHGHSAKQVQHDKKQAGQILDMFHKGLTMDGYLRSRHTVKARKELAERLINLVVNARRGLEKMREAYQGNDKSKQRQLVDACVSVAKKVGSQTAFKFWQVEGIVDRALVIQAMIKHAPRWEGDVRTWAPDDAPRWNGELGPNAEEQGRASRNQFWASQWSGIQADNRALFRQTMNEGGMTGIVKRVSKELGKKQVRFADSESKQLVWALSIKTKAENKAEVQPAVLAAGNSGLSGPALRAARLRASGQSQQIRYKWVDDEGEAHYEWYDKTDEANMGPDALLKSLEKNPKEINPGKPRKVLLDAKERGVGPEHVVADPMNQQSQATVAAAAHQAARDFHQRKLIDDADYARDIAHFYGSNAEEVEMIEEVAESLMGNDSGSED